MSYNRAKVPCGFNPRTPCGVRHTGTGGFLLRTKFQSTHSLRSATPPAFSKIILSPVSIHALLAECDYGDDYATWTSRCFNPRTPCGVRLTTSLITLSSFPFQSTHSLRSATASRIRSTEASSVSIHALLAECDQLVMLIEPLLCSFNPRTPCGVRLRLTIYIVIQQRKRYFAPTSRRRPSSPSLLF